MLNKIQGETNYKADFNEKTLGRDKIYEATVALIKKAAKSGSSNISLDLRGIGLDRLPIEITQLKSCLTALNLGNNKLSSLPNEIGQLSKLSILVISNNPDLCQLPMSLGEIPSLCCIDFYKTGSDIEMLGEQAHQILRHCRDLRSNNS